jgi:hypothetical protein
MPELRQHLSSAPGEARLDGRLDNIRRSPGVIFPVVLDRVIDKRRRSRLPGVQRAVCCLS